MITAVWVIRTTWKAAKHVESGRVIKLNELVDLVNDFASEHVDAESVEDYTLNELIGWAMRKGKVEK